MRGSFAFVYGLLEGMLKQFNELYFLIAMYTIYIFELNKC